MGGRSIRDNPSHPVTQMFVQDLPGYKTLKYRQTGQNTEDEIAKLDLKSQLRKAEQGYVAATEAEKRKRELLTGEFEQDGRTEDTEESEQAIEEKRRRMLEQAEKLDAEDSDSDESSSDSESDDDEDDTEELLRELEKIKKERAELKEQEERVRVEHETEQLERDIALGNPLMMPADFKVKRR
jgi:protein CWC15